MLKALQEISHDALGLSRNQRLALAQFLLKLDETGPNGSNEGVDAAWDTEIRARLQAFDEGRAGAISYDLVRQRMMLRFAK